MGKRIKKGKKGEAGQYVTRAQSLRKLQVSLADFRRLCILKGIYPRDPKKKPGGKDKTYYHIKDIRFLLHEPLLRKFFLQKTFMKKYTRLVGRKERETAKRYEENNKPTYTLHHLVKERYPRFDDALRDIDDALSMAALFDTLPAEKKKSIVADATLEPTRLIQEFQLYCIRQRRLRKVFASIKGFYYQVDINGTPVTWLAPHRFSQNLPSEVDFRVMATFLELHRTVLKFVNYRLFKDGGLKYPPVAEDRMSKNAGGAGSLRVEHLDVATADEVKEDEKMEKAIVSDFGEVDEVKELNAQKMIDDKKASVFSKLKVFICREVPFDSLYFCLRACGATVGWPRDGSPFDEDHAEITHVIMDRPKQGEELQEGREYVQPQWVFDCINEGKLLPVGDYGPNKVPPPHLSPFEDYEREGYVPERRAELDKLENDAPSEEEEEAGDEVDPEELHLAEVAAEAAGRTADEGVGTEVKKVVSKAKRALLEEKENEERLKSMLSKKHKRIVDYHEKKDQEKADKVEKLTKRRKISEGGSK